MIREELLDKLDAGRLRLLMVLEPLSDAALTQPDVMDHWSIADILAHLVAWESELVTALLRINQGKKPAKLLSAYDDVDGYNAQRFTENQGRDLDPIFDDLQGVRRQLEHWLEEFSEEELTDPDRYGWAKGKPLWEFIADNSFGHEEEHIPDIESFSTRWKANQDLKKLKNSDR